ncbi:hypothetical protein [Metabacillus arenae]|uniref:Uncharacterized protein n=1 Tax=Metabacillus arenae TaxID=2771434 RepID=A0A926RZS7_9BACI|nr:hypothetical protein [Metabacillus arenae]MBD1382562.1 hypothetical protein [Metabacillus arenae]
MNFFVRFCILMVGVLLEIAGGLMLVFDLNSYNYYKERFTFIEYIQIITGSYAFYLLLIGFIIIVAGFYYPASKK